MTNRVFVVNKLVKKLKTAYGKKYCESNQNTTKNYIPTLVESDLVSTLRGASPVNGVFRSLISSAD